MNIETELELKRQLENTITKSISDIINTFRKHPMFYLNEEDIRCDLYSKITNSYPHKLYLKTIKNPPFKSNAVHIDAINKLPNEKGNPKPDLLAYYAVTSKIDPILVLTNLKKPENVYFYKKNGGKHNNKRIIVEIKFTDHTKSSGKSKGIIDDLNKIEDWEAWKKYILYFDRSNRLDEKKEYIEIIEKMKNIKNQWQTDVEFYYLGMPSYKSTKDGQIYHYVNGEKIRDERFKLSH